MTEATAKEVHAMDVFGISKDTISKQLGVSLKQINTELGESEPASTDQGLKPNLLVAAEAVLKRMVASVEDQDSTELARTADAIAKLHTAFCKETPGAVINIQSNQLNQFRTALKD